MGIQRTSWGSTSDGHEVELFTMTNDKGMEATVATYGATLVGVTAPDRNGTFTDVVLGFDNAPQYQTERGYMGATIGRVANRVSGSRFTLDGVHYDLRANKEGFQIHGGAGGFHSRVWTAKPVDGEEPSVVMGYRSNDGEEGYPGDLDATVIYTLTHDGLRITWRAVTDAPTIVTMTNHVYFNLSGTDSSIEDHTVHLDANKYLLTDERQIPTGMLASVAGTPLDFTTPTVVGDRIDADDPAINVAHGYDHFYVIEGEPGTLRRAARIEHTASGRRMEIHTTQPGMQLYTANHLPNGISGKKNAKYGFRSGLCVETQAYVDAPNRPEFPSIVLRPGETYEHVTEYRFSAS